MATPCAIRFLDKSGIPFTGLYIHYDCSLNFVINSILNASQNIVPFPIRIMSTEKRLLIRKQSAENRGCSERDLRFAYGIDKYAIAFSASLYNLFDVYENQNEGIVFDFGDGPEELEAEFYSGTEDFISSLDLSSGYKNNIVYLVDIMFPEKDSIGLDYEPVISIQTGTNEQIFQGNLSLLKLKKAALIKANK